MNPTNIPLPSHKKEDNPSDFVANFPAINILEMPCFKNKNVGAMGPRRHQKSLFWVQYGRLLKLCVMIHITIWWVFARVINKVRLYKKMFHQSSLRIKKINKPLIKTPNNPYLEN